jgi:hypothetical protein
MTPRVVVGIGAWIRRCVSLRVAAMGIVCSLLMSGSSEAAGTLVTFPSPSGRLVTGLLTEADQEIAPAVILVPMLGRPKEDWQPVADRLAAGGVHALAIDLPALVLPSDSRELVAWSDDIRAAVSFLAGRGDVMPGSVGLAGASLGANLVAVAAAADLGVRSIALVSPSLDYRGVRIAGAMQLYGARQAFFVASVQDPYAARSVRELQEIGDGSREVRWSYVPAHGTALLSLDLDLVRSLVEWFQRTLW